MLCFERPQLLCDVDAVEVSHYLPTRFVQSIRGTIRDALQPAELCQPPQLRRYQFMVFVEEHLVCQQFSRCERLTDRPTKSAAPSQLHVSALNGGDRDLIQTRRSFFEVAIEPVHCND